MEEPSAGSTKLRFGLCEIDLRRGELRRRGRRVPLQGKPFRVLEVLLERPGEVVPRGELQKKLWPSGTFVQFEDGLNHAIKKLRDALGDSAENPLFIETVPRRGYRFIAPVELVGPEPPGGAESAERHRPAFIAASALMLIFAALTLPSLRSSPENGEVIRFSVSPPGGTGIPRQASVRVSPDGRHLAFVVLKEGSRVLAVRSLDTVAIKILPGTDGALRPFWSPDSQWIGFFTWRELRAIRVDGGDAQTVCEVAGFVGGTWNEKGVILFGGRDAGGLYRVPAGGGRPVPITAPDAMRGELYLESPHFLPDGDHFLYFAQSSDREKTGIYVGSLTSRQRTFLVHARSEAMYVAPGYLLVPRGGELVARGFDAKSLDLSEEAFSLAEKIQYRQEVAAFSASQDGVLAYRAHSAESIQRRLTWFDRQGRKLGPIGEVRRWTEIALSPDENRLVAADVEPSGRGHDIWLLDLTRQGAASRFTLDAGADIINPVWSPYGRSIAFSSRRDGTSFDLYRKAMDRDATPELLLRRREALFASDWSRDGRFLAYDASREGPSGIYVLPLVADREPVAIESSSFSIGRARFSPDGKWIAYVSDETGRLEVYVRPVARQGSKQRVSHRGGAQPQWRRDGGELYYLSLDGTMMSVEMTLGERLAPGIPKPLFDTELQVEAEPFGPHYAAADDGRRFLIAVPTDDPEPITVVLNWTEALPR